MIFGNPEHRQWTLNLYNAVNGSNYDDPSQITYNTIGEVLYMGMRNDVSFVLDMWLNIYGHQSTLNPNMPVIIRNCWKNADRFMSIRGW